MLRMLRSRSPQESLGGNAQSGLLPAFLLAAVVSIGLLAALTVVPFYCFPPDQKMTALKKDDARIPPALPPTVPTTPEGTAKKSPDAVPNPGKTPPKKDILDVLGETGTKTGSPKNPLDRKDDDLLKDLK